MTDQGLKLFVKRLTKTATLPRRASDGAAGYDLSSDAHVVVPAKGKEIVPTNISIQLPLGTYGRVAPRSGLVVRHFIDVGAGVIDRDYRGAVGVVLFNHSDKDFEVKPGDRVAQLILERIAIADVHEVDDLPDAVTERGAGGYGSTGVGTEDAKVNTADSRANVKPKTVLPAERNVIAGSVFLQALTAEAFEGLDDDAVDETRPASRSVAGMDTSS